MSLRFSYKLVNPNLLLDNALIIFPKDVTPNDFEELYALVVKQLAKDFHPYAELSEQPTLLTAEWIFEQTQRMISQVIQKENHALGYIIYRVDIPEKTMQKAMLGLAGDEKLNALTQLVLKREAQKVWIRKRYS